MNTKEGEPLWVVSDIFASIVIRRLEGIVLRVAKNACLFTLEMA